MFYLTLVSLIWAFSFGLMKGELTGLDSGLVAFLRLALALPIFLPLLKLCALRWRQTGWLLLIGAVQYGVMYDLYVASFARLDAYQVAILTVTTPLFVTLIYDALLRRFHLRNLVFAALAVVGAGVLVFDGRPLQAVGTGIVLMQLSNACFAFGQVAYKRFMQSQGALQDSQVFGLLYIGAVAFCFVSTSAGGGWADLGAISSRQWWVLVYLGVLSSGLCFFWWNKGAVQTGPGVLAVFNNVKIPLTVLVSLLVFGEQTEVWRLLCGGGIIAVALLLAAGRRNKGVRAV